MSGLNVGLDCGAPDRTPALLPDLENWVVTFEGKVA